VKFLEEIQKGMEGVMRRRRKMEKNSSVITWKRKIVY